MKKTITRIVAIVAMMAIVLAMAGCSGGTAAVQYAATSATGSMTEQAGLGNIIRTQNGMLTLYDDGTYELVTDVVQYADWGSVVVASFMTKQYGTWTSEFGDEYGVQAKLAVPDRVVASVDSMFTGWDGLLAAIGAEEGAAFESTTHIKDSANLSENDKALFDQCMSVLASQGVVISAETTVEITLESNTYEVVG